MKKIKKQQFLARIRHGLIGALFATTLVSGSGLKGATYFSENFDTLDNAGLTNAGWQLDHSVGAIEINTDFNLVQYPYASTDYTLTGLVPDTSFYNLVTTEKIVTPAGVNGIASSLTNGGYLISDSDRGTGSANIGSDSQYWAITPSFSTVGASVVWWHADAEIENNNNGEGVVDLSFSVDGGATWVQAWATAELQRPTKAYGFSTTTPGYEGGTQLGGYPLLGSYSQTKTWSGIHGRWHVQLPAAANNKPSVKLRLRQTDPSDGWYNALDNVVVDNNPPPQGSQVVLSESFVSGIPATWKNLSSPQKWGAGPLTNLDGSLKKTWSATDLRPIHIDLLRNLDLLRAGGTNLAPAAVLNWSVTNFTDYPEHQTYHPNNPTDGRFVNMLAGGNYAMWQADDAYNISDLDSPTLNLGSKSEVFLDFDSEWLNRVYTPGDPTVSQNFLAQVSLDGGATFTNVFDYQAALSNIGEGSYYMHHYIPVPQAAGNTNVVFRFHAEGIDAGNGGTRHEGFWVIDNVRVTANVLTLGNLTITRSGGNVNFTWTGGTGIRLQKTTPLVPASWTDIGSTLGNSSHSEAIGAGPTFFRLFKP